MTQEEKDLLLRDLCARLPYGVKFATKYSHFNDTHELLVINKHSTIVETFKMLWWDIEDVKPYLRPMSSMTEEEEEERQELWHSSFSPAEYATLFLDFCNALHLDYRGLIHKGLAISTEEFNPYKN